MPPPLADELVAEAERLEQAARDHGPLVTLDACAVARLLRTAADVVTVGWEANAAPGPMPVRREIGPFTRPAHIDDSGV